MLPRNAHFFIFHFSSSARSGWGVVVELQREMAKMFMNFLFVLKSHDELEMFFLLDPLLFRL